MSFFDLIQDIYETEDITLNDNKEEILDNDSDEDDEYEEMLMSCEDDDESIIPELYFCNPDPYLKPEPLPDNHFRHEICFDDEGSIVVKNLDAYWLPEMKLVEEIGGTIYTVTGSYEGTELLSKKLSRIMLYNLEESE